MLTGPRITRKEWIWVAAASAVILSLTSLPTLAGAAAQTDDWVFGGAVYDRQDYAIHLSAIQQGVRGAWQYQILVTADPHPAGWIRLFYLGIGHAARLSGLSVPSAYHVARVAFGAAALAAVYAFAARYLWPVALRRTAFLFFALGSGLGWLQLLLGWSLRPDLSPIDFWLIDAYGFYSLLVFPHFAAVIALLALGFDRLAAFFEAGKLRDLLLMAAAGVALQVVQPFAPWILDVTALALVVRPRSANRRLLTVLAILAASQAPYFAYSLAFFGSSPAWISFQEQNITLSPPPTAYLLGYGVLAPLAVWGAVRLLRRTSGTVRLPAIWVLTAFALAYLPWNLQRRFTEGVMVPLAILAALGLGYGLLPAVRRRLASRLGAGAWRRVRNLVLPTAAGAASLSSLVLALGGVAFALTRSAEAFDPASIYAAAERLRAISPWGETVLAAEPTGRILAATIGRRVVVGHVIETPFYQERSRQVEAFFDVQTGSMARRDLLRMCRCAFVFYGPYEREVGDWDPEKEDYLEVVFTVEEVTVYRVQLSPGP